MKIISSWQWYQDRYHSCTPGIILGSCFLKHSVVGRCKYMINIVGFFLVYEHITQVSSRFSFLLKLQLKCFCQKAVLVLQQSSTYSIWGGGGIHTLIHLHTVFAFPLLTGAAQSGEDKGNPFCFKGSKDTWCVHWQWRSGQLTTVDTHYGVLTGCPERLCRLHLQRFSRANWSNPRATWSLVSSLAWAKGWTKNLLSSLLTQITLWYW